mmetsp:Transcript_31380/g.62643  ORF Transcript_31380/g.62643 Transcript_31380/m.62643 type:complete len:379 (-) Transcript_31380:41-1177(-)
MFRSARKLAVIQTLSHEYVAVGDCGPTSSKQTVLLLHGLLGNKKNLKSFAKLICQEFPDDWQVLLMDLRGHGATPRLNPLKEEKNQTAGSDTPMLYLAAEDIAHTCDSIGAPPPEIVCGHSMGGKVALAYLHSCLSGSFNGNANYFALHGSRCAPYSTWTLDSQPLVVDRREAGEAQSEEESVASVFAAIGRVSAASREAPAVMESKGALAAALIAEGCSENVAAWMTTNVEPASSLPGSGGGLRFVFDLDACDALFASYAEVDFLPLVHLVAQGKNLPSKGHSGGHTFGDVSVPTMCSLEMVRAGRNKTYWLDADVAALEEACGGGGGGVSSDGSEVTDSDDSGSRLHLLPNSGHNVHIDDPLGLLSLMRPTLDRLA